MDKASAGAERRTTWKIVSYFTKLDMLRFMKTTRDLYGIRLSSVCFGLLAAACLPLPAANGLAAGASTMSDANHAPKSEAPRTSWAQRHRDPENTGRADFSVPANRMNSSFFDVVRWQKPSPGSPQEGNLGASSMVFFDRAGPEGADVVAAGYHWPKGVQGMDRQTGRLLWNGNPEGGESIGENTPAFSPDGATLYVINDATGHPLMAFAATNGPSAYWHNGGDSDPDRLSAFSPKVGPDGRIFSHGWGEGPHAGTDSGTAITVTWSAARGIDQCVGSAAIWTTSEQTNVLASGRMGELVAFDGTTGVELWSVNHGLPCDADPTVDPTNGNVYLPVGFESIRIVGVTAAGQPLWSEAAVPVFDYQEGVNDRQRAQSAGCLAHDGRAYYFQTVSEEGDGALYAIDTTNGAVRWFYPTGSKGWEVPASAPIVTENGVIIVGNNYGGMYFALRDDGTNATLLDTLAVAPGGDARNTATLAADGVLYLPTRVAWIQSNGDGDVPTQQAANLFNAFDLQAEPQITLPPPAAQAARPLNAAIEVRWQPVDDIGGGFSHYAVYRASAPFTSLEGLTPAGLISNRLASAWLDAPLVNGAAYYYFVATVTLAGPQPTLARSIGGYRPYDETDLQVVSIARTPRFPRYAAEYTDYETTEPSGYGPYHFSAATGLGQGQDANTQRRPATNDPVTYTVTVRNRGSNPWTNAVAGDWFWDGTNAEPASAAGPVAPGGLLTFPFTRPWDGATHAVRFQLAGSDARAGNNSVGITTKSVAFLSYIDEAYYESFRFQSTNWAGAVTDDMIDWIQRHMARFNEMFASAGSAKRVHYDVLELLADTALDPAIDTQPFAIFPFRFHAAEAAYSYRNSGYYNPGEDIDFGYLHEMGHQLGLIDIYQIDIGGEANQVSGLGYSAPDDLMRGCSPFLSPHSALGMDHWRDQAHGYFGQYLYGIPEQVSLRFLKQTGAPLAGANVKMYQLEERPGLGKVITPQVKAQGVTDTNGVLLLPNVAIDPAKVPPLPTGDALRANPFGYVAVVGYNGLLHFSVEYEGAVDYTWLDITEANVAYYQGQTNEATFERQVSLGGPMQRFPPRELTETNVADWICWAEGGSAGGSTISDDPSRRRAGQTALRFVTDGGFDTYVRYPGGYQAQWDLTGASALNISFYAENPHGFQNGSPWLRLKDGTGSYFQYQFFQNGEPRDLLEDAREAWQDYQIPLGASNTEENGWRRTTFGAPDLTRIAALEIHADTWDSGFTLWLDGVSFEPTPRPRLAVGTSGGGLVLSWPATVPALALEAAENVNGPYETLEVTTVEAGGMATVQLPLTTGRRCFRLRLP